MPAESIFPWLRQHDVGESHRAFDADGGLEKRSRCSRQPIAGFRIGRIPADLIEVDQPSVPRRVVDATGDIPDLMADGKYHLGSRVVMEIGTVDFQPQALGALAVGDDLGFGEVTHGGF